MRLPAAYLELDPRVIPVRTRVANEEQREKKKRERGKGRKREGKKKNYRSRKLSRFAPPLPLSLSLFKRRNTSDSLPRSSREERGSIESRHDSRNGTFELGDFSRICSLPFLVGRSVGRSIGWKIEKNIARERERERETL